MPAVTEQSEKTGLETSATPSTTNVTSQSTVAQSNSNLGPMNPALRPPWFSIDHVFMILSRTIFSPIFCFLLTALALFELHDFDNTLFWGCGIWSIVIIVISAFNYIDSRYSNGKCERISNWREEIVLITGGGSGIGALLADTLTNKGATVVVLVKHELKDVKSKGNLLTYVCDVSNYQQVQAVSETVNKEVGDPTIIVNNAGVVKGKLLLDLTEDDVKDTFGSNTLAHFWILKAFLPSLLMTGKGHIVTVSSVMGLVACAQMTDYCASKAALVNLHQSLRFELDNRYQTPNIKTTLLLPSFITTNLFSSLKLPRNPLLKFIAPPLHPQTVVDSIVSALEANKSRVIRLPSYTQLGRIWGAGPGIVPRWFADLVHWFTGADHAMEGYGPQPDAAERLQLEKSAIEHQNEPVAA